MSATLAAARPPRLAERVVVVTGAAAGIGKAYALALAAEGARVVLCDVDDPAPLAAAIEADGGQALARVADVTSAEALAGVVGAAVERFGAIHALVNNAGLYTALKKRRFEEIPSDEWDRVMAVNARGTFECVKAVAPVMRRQGYGKIVNVASGTVFKGSTGLLHYVASKGAVVAMTRVLARELGGDGIRVNAVAPGFTETENAAEHAKDSGPTVASRCLKRPETPDDVVGSVVFLCSAESDFITGQTLVVDGGAVFR